MGLRLRAGPDARGAAASAPSGGGRVDAGVPVDRRSAAAWLGRCAGATLVADGDARRTGPCAQRQRERIHCEGGAGVARESRREDALHWAGQPLGEWLGGEPQRQAA